jgi:Fic family protein
MEKLVSYQVEANVLYRTVNDLPILPRLATNLDEELIVRSIFGTAAIEGNPLEEEKVAEILSQEKIADKPQDAEKEIQNLKEAYNYVTKSEPSGSPIILQEEMIKKIHHIITKDIKYKFNNPGHYRNHLVRVGDIEHGGIYTPPKILEDIKTLMKKFFSWINCKEIINTDPWIRAALAHYHLGLIHPFGNGNGRMARLVEALVLCSSGIRYVPIMLSNYYYRNIDEYFLVFSKSRKNRDNNVNHFLEFVFKGIVESLEEIKGRITAIIRLLTLQDYYKHLLEGKGLTKRQYELLMILLDYRESFTFKDLLNISPFHILYEKISDRTARRDVDKLLGKKLLTKEGDDYKLNFRLLG